MKKTKTIEKWREFEERVQKLVPIMNKIDNQIEELGAIIKNSDLRGQDVEVLLDEINSLDTFGGQIFKLRNEIKSGLNWGVEMLDPDSFLEGCITIDSLEIRVKELEEKGNNFSLK